MQRVVYFIPSINGSGFVISTTHVARTYLPIYLLIHPSGIANNIIAIISKEKNKPVRKSQRLNMMVRIPSVHIIIVSFYTYNKHFMYLGRSCGTVH